MTAAPILPATLRWLVRPPLHQDTGLTGHVVVVVAFRVGCALCREALTEVARATAPFAGQALAVVALHVPIEPGEHDVARVLRELDGLPCAAAIDAGREWLRAQDVRSLPHLALLGVDGQQVWSGTGVPFRRRLHDAIDALLHAARRDGRAATVPWLPLRAATNGLRPTALAAVGDELWLASAGQRRVFALDGAGRVLRSFGSGRAGQADGSAAQAEFVQPAALLALGEHVLVADAGAHTVRAVDRQSGDVATWCGNGQRGLDRQGGGYARDQSLCGPRALCQHDGGVVMAMALGRQLWQFDPGTRAAVAWCGSGERACSDGEAAAFVEPCALAIDGETLFVADAAAGAIRALDLAHGRLSTRWRGLQRPSALCLHDEQLFVADRWQGAVLRGRLHDNGPAPFLGREHGLVEPVALTMFGGRLWIADAGADALFVADLSGAVPQVQRIDIDAVVAPAAIDARHFAVLAGALHLREHADVPLRIPVSTFARDGELCTIDVLDEGAPLLACARNVSVAALAGHVEVLLPIGQAGGGAFRLRMRSGTAQRQFVVPVYVDADGREAAALSLEA